MEYGVRQIRAIGSFCRAGLICVLLASCSKDKGGGGSNSSNSVAGGDEAAVPALPSAVIQNPDASLGAHYSNTDLVSLDGSCEDESSVEAVIYSGSSQLTSDKVPCDSSAFSFEVPLTQDGSFDVAVTQVVEGEDGTRSEATQLQWVRDTVAPAAPQIQSPSLNPYLSGDSSIQLTGTCEEGAAVSLSGAETQMVACTDGTFVFTLLASADGVKQYSLSQMDLAGNFSGNTDFQWTRDTSLPFTPVIASPSTTPVYTNVGQLALAGSCEAGNEVVLAGDVLVADVLSPAGQLSQTCAVDGSFSYQLTKTADGTFQLDVHQVSAANGLNSSQAMVTWIFDSMAPLVPSITAPVDNPHTGYGPITLRGACEAGIQVDLSGADTQSMVCASDSTYIFTFNQTVEGTYLYQISQTDLAQNTSASATFTWNMVIPDPLPPVIVSPVLSPYSGALGNLTLSGSCTDDLIVQLVDLSDSSANQSVTCASQQFDFILAQAADGTYDYELTQINGAFVSPVTPFQWILDSTAPETSFASTPPAQNAASEAVFEFSADESPVTYECNLDGAGFAVCTSPMTYLSLATGIHQLEVRARDALGNVDATPALYQWEQISFNTIALYHFDIAKEYLDSSLYAGDPLNNHDLVSQNTVSIAGPFGEAQSFASAQSAFLSASNTDALRSSGAQMTVETFVQLDSLPANNEKITIASFGGPAGDRGWRLCFTRKGKNYYLVFYASIDGNNESFARSRSINLQIGQYYHVAATWNYGAVNLFVDGFKEGSKNIGTVGDPLNTIFASTAALRLGTDEDGHYLDGSLDEFRLSRTVRWDMDFTPPAAPYVAD